MTCLPIPYVCCEHVVYDRSGWSCHCCASASRDYPLMQLVKTSMTSSSSRLRDVVTDCNGVEQEDNYDVASQDGSDDDFGLGEDDFLTPYEQERRYAMMEALNIRNQALSYGFGIHAVDSLQHILSLLKLVDNLVLHVFVPSSMFSARLDCALEVLSERYVGCMFRRIRYEAKLQEMFNLSDLTLCSSQSYLICFREGRAVAHIRDMQELGSESYLDTNALQSFLENVGVLRLSLDETTLNKFQSMPQSNGGESILRKITGIEIGGDDDEDEDEDEDESNDVSKAYCGDPACGRLYPHEHISSGGASSTGGASFLLKSGVDEIFARNELTRV